VPGNRLSKEPDDWWSHLGDALAVERLENGDDKSTRLIYYLGGKLDFTLVSVDDVLHRGINSLVPNP